MKSIKLIALLLSILAVLCTSCSESSQEDKSTKKVRALRLQYNQLTNSYSQVDSIVHTIFVDTAHRIGDMIGIDHQKYRIIN